MAVVAVTLQPWLTQPDQGDYSAHHFPAYLCTIVQPSYHYLSSDMALLATLRRMTEKVSLGQGYLLILLFGIVATFHVRHVYNIEVAKLAAPRGPIAGAASGLIVLSSGQHAHFHIADGIFRCGCTSPFSVPLTCRLR